MMLNIDFVIRLLVAGILGAIIGLDREYRAKEAGYRTHFLVSLGSALIMIVSQYGFQEIIKESSVTLDPSRVAAGQGEAPCPGPRLRLGLGPAAACFRQRGQGLRQPAL